MIKPAPAVKVTENAHDPRFDQFFPLLRRDAFHEAGLLGAMSAHWFSLLVTDGRDALHNAVSPLPIFATRLSDVEPFLGYAGFLYTSADPAFLEPALAAYSETCKALGIVAELVRFDPILANHVPLAGRYQRLEVEIAKQVVVADCPPEESKLVERFSRGCRRDVRRGLRDFTFKPIDDITAFRNLYEDAMRRIDLERHWFFDDRFYKQVSAEKLFAPYGVFANDRLVCAALAIHHETASHYTLAASIPDYPIGASELLVFGIAKESARRGIRRLMLGGGHTSSPDDSLLWFKRKFARETVDFAIGKIVHDAVAYERLCTEAIRANPSLSSSPYFLRYRH